MPRHASRDVASEKADARAKATNASTSNRFASSWHGTTSATSGGVDGPDVDGRDDARAAAASPTRGERRVDDIATRRETRAARRRLALP